MQSISKQRGLTAISWFVVIAVGIMVSIFLLRLIPIYIDGFSVAQSVDVMKTDKKLLKSSVKEIKKSLLLRLSINSVYSVKADDIYVTKKANKVIVEVDYEIREKVVGNLDFVVSFKNEVTIQ